MLPAMANAPKIHQLKVNLIECKQGGMDVVDYYGRFVNLWSELENQVQFPQCPCKKCECGIGDKLVKMLKEEKAHQF